MLKLTTDDFEGKSPEISESLHELDRQGTRRMILATLQLDVEQYVQALRHLRDELSQAATVRTRKKKFRSAGSRKTGLAMAFSRCCLLRNGAAGSMHLIWWRSSGLA